MKIIRYPVKMLDTLADRIAAVVGAVAGSQLPGFIQHYTQRLGGHAAEAERNLQSWCDVASRTGCDGVEDLAHTYLISADPKVAAAGQKCLADIARVDELQEALLALQDSSLWSRPFVFLKNFDSEVADATLKHFTMNVPLDAEGLVYAALGLVFCLFLYLGIRQIGIRALRKIRRKPSELL